MMKTSEYINNQNKIFYWLFMVTMMIGLFLTTKVNYLLFHSIAELFSVVVAASVFIITWNSVKYIKNPYLITVGVSYFFIGILDLLHTLAYKGMPIFTDYDYYANQLWIAARSMESITLLAAFILLFAKKKPRVDILFLCYSTLTTLLVASIFYWKVFPVCFVEGEGLTNFKIYSEYAICSILVVSILLLIKNRSMFTRQVFDLVLLSIIFTIISELSFTFYIDNYGISNIVGHYFKIISFLMIYQAIISTGIAEPYRLIFKELSVANENLQKEIELRKKIEIELESEIIARKQVEKVQQNILQRFYLMLSSMYSGVLLVTEEGRVEFINKAFCDAFGLKEKQADLVGLDSQDLLEMMLPAFQAPPEAATRLLEIIERGEPVKVEQFAMQGGRTALRDFIPLHVNGKSSGRLWIYTDITEHKRAEEALRESEQRYRLATEATRVGIWEWNVLTNQIRWDHQMFRIYGISPTEDGFVQYSDWSGAVLPADLPQQEEILQNTARRGGQSSREFRIHRREDKACRYIQAVETVRTNAQGQIEWVIGTNLDITERHQAVESLRESEQFNNAVLDTVGSLVLVLDMEGRIMRFNQACEAVTGYAATDVMGRVFWEFLVPQEELEGVRLTWERLQAGDFPNSHENHWIVRDGSRRLVMWTNTAIVRNGKVDCIIGSGLDITERRQAEEALKVLNQELEQRVNKRTRQLQEAQSQYLHSEKLAAIGKLSASIAHEFNNPLQCLIPILQGFKTWQYLEEKDRALLDLAISESHRMKDLIRNLQDFNRPSSGKKIFTDVHSIINSLLLFCKSDFKRKGISTVLNYTDRVPHILAIPDQIKQVFLNLLNNAGDACRHGGVITISTWQVKQRVAVAIMDNGTGIEPEKIDQIFQPFYTTKPAVKGTGLGLSVCHGIVQNHHGEIHVVSQVGEGSTFTVLLPINGDDQIDQT